jgi:hypothetical protein
MKKYYKLKDIKPPCLVTFEKHNGKGRPITYRTIFIDYIEDNYFSYHTYTGHGGNTFNSKESKIIDIKYYNKEE